MYLIGEYKNYSALRACQRLTTDFILLETLSRHYSSTKTSWYLYCNKKVNLGWVFLWPLSPVFLYVLLIRQYYYLFSMHLFRIQQVLEYTWLTQDAQEKTSNTINEEMHLPPPQFVYKSSTQRVRGRARRLLKPYLNHIARCRLPYSGRLGNYSYGL